LLTNKANYLKSQMNVTDTITKDYKIITLGGRRNNKAKQSHFKGLKHAVFYV
jgi:hypothetical protein